MAAMTPTHSVLLTIGLFGLTFLSPGPNLLIVVQSSLASGRAAGVAAGFGVAAGDAIYAALGLFGMAALIAQSGDLFAVVKIVGGLYLLWLAWKMMKGGDAVAIENGNDSARSGLPPAKLFVRGLVTDLANPQTVLFFASIFAVTLTATTPAWAKALSWLGIVAVSATWRCLLSFAFSRRRVRAFYARSQRAIERLAGAAFAVFGAKLLVEGISVK
jgi:amino acid exporter